jgi:hypothetical protein
MPRNGSGTYSLPSSAFVSGTIIASTPMNNNFGDIASALTQSISLDGQTTLTGAIKFINGTAAAPGVTFAGDSTTGFYLSAAGVLGFTAGSTSVGTWSSSGLSNATLVSPTISSPTVSGGTFSSPTVSGTLAGVAATFSSTLGVTGLSTLSGGLKGPQFTIEFTFGPGNAVISTGLQGWLQVPVACTINEVTMLVDQSGSIVCDIWRTTQANYSPPTHPAVGDSITASDTPTISSATKMQDSTLTGWTTSLNQGDILAFNVNSVTTCERATISLICTRQS